MTSDVSKKIKLTFDEQRAADRLIRKEYDERSEALALIINPLRTAKYECDVMWSDLDAKLLSFTRDYGMLEMNPDFQRGHVWTEDQQTNYIKNVLRGVVSTSGFVVQFNCPNFDEYGYKGDLPVGVQCIDGLQRVTAVQKFIAEEVRPWGLTPKDLFRSRFMINNRIRFRFAIHDFRTKVDLLSHYLDLNDGGTPHTPEELARIYTMRDQAIEK